MSTIAIMQPTFLPWIGYFSLIDRVDHFVFLDQVQFDKRSWQQRNQIKTAQEPMWLSVPVATKGQQNQAIEHVEILYEGSKHPLEKLFRALEFNYKKAPYFNDYAEGLSALLLQQCRYLSDLNQDLIRWLCGLLRIDTPFVCSSELGVTGTKDALLVTICQAMAAKHYISPPGSKAYLASSDAFEQAQIGLSYHDYQHPTYRQLHGEFAPYMCILDLLFNEGPNSLDILRSGLPS